MGGLSVGSIEERIASLGYSLPDAAAPVANYVSTVSVEGAGLVFTSGHVPRNADGSFVTGRLGDDVSIEDGYEAAKSVGLALLASLKVELGDLDRVSRVVKVLCMVNCTSDFADQPAVANGASDLMVEVFGDKGRHAALRRGHELASGQRARRDRDGRQGLVTKTLLERLSLVIPERWALTDGPDYPLWVDAGPWSACIRS